MVTADTQWGILRGKFLNKVNVVEVNTWYTTNVLFDSEENLSSHLVYPFIFRFGNVQPTCSS